LEDESKGAVNNLNLVNLSES